MKILQFYKLSIIYALINMLDNIVNYIKDRSKIGDIFYGEGFRTIVSKYLVMELKEDWIGRLYGVLNPLVDIKGNINIDNVIVELDGDNTNNNDFVRTWIMKQLNMVGELFRINGLYEYIDLEIKHVGPINVDNYLVIFDIASRKIMGKSIKRFIVQSILYSAIILGIIFFI